MSAATTISPTPAAAAAVPSADGDSPGRVLVVDDDEANRESLSRRLARHGYVIDTAVDGAGCLAAVARSPFDVILLDVQMPGMSGLEALTEIRRTASPTELPIIMATARSDSGDVVEALGLGANDYVTKPLDFPVVLARVRTQVALRRSVARVVALTQSLDAQNAELAAANAELGRAAERDRFELELAAKVQATYLPAPWADGEGGLRVAWRYEPCAGLAGDALGAVRLDAEHVALYVLDVSGHGVAAALTAVSVARLLAPAHDPNSILMRAADGRGPSRPAAPADVVNELGRRFAWNAELAQFITLFYGLIHLPTGTLTYASAGHPGPILIRRGAAPLVLESTGLPVGIASGEEFACQQRQHTLARGDRLYAYSDGVSESDGPGAEQLGVAGLAKLLSGDAEDLDCRLESRLSATLRALDVWRGRQPARDDVTLLAIEVVS